MRLAVVEDEQDLASSLKEGLEFEGYPTETFSSAEAFMDEEKEDKKPVRLLILDLMLPGKNGTEMCTVLRQAGETFPILILTAKDTTEEKIRALNAGADDYLVKPFSFDELVARVRALIRRGEPLGRILSLGGVVLDYSTREVTRNGFHIPLTVKEFELLAFLMQNAGKALPRDLISSRVWEGEPPSPTNNIDVHVSKLRKKIDDPYDTKLISTVRGVGYTFAH